jgi:hypothetical protein
LEDALFGKINTKPGLVEVEEQLTGDRFKLEERIANAKNESIKKQIEEVKRAN